VNSPPEPGTLTLWWWQLRIRRARKGMTHEQVEKRLGTPSRRFEQAGVELWIYDLRRAGGILYSIRVAFTEGRVGQSYLGIELVGET
jgi:hypothetical protein